jgi:hypothetical protein
LGDIDRGYRGIDVTGKDGRLYSLTCPLMLAQILVAIPKYTKGKLTLVAKNKEGQPLKSKVEALDDPRDDTPDLLAPPGTMDNSSVATVTENGAVRESRNGRRSWITSGASRPRVLANFPLSLSMSGLQRSELSKWADRVWTKIRKQPIPHEHPMTALGAGMPRHSAKPGQNFFLSPSETPVLLGSSSFQLRKIFADTNVSASSL